jgi:hypothetical protein
VPRRRDRSAIRVAIPLHREYAVFIEFSSAFHRVAARRS